MMNCNVATECGGQVRTRWKPREGHLFQVTATNRFMTKSGAMISYLEATNTASVPSKASFQRCNASDHMMKKREWLQLKLSDGDLSSSVAAVASRITSTHLNVFIARHCSIARENVSKFCAGTTQARGSKTPLPGSWLVEKTPVHSALPAGYSIPMSKHAPNRPLNKDIPCDVRPIQRSADRYPQHRLQVRLRLCESPACVLLFSRFAPTLQVCFGSGFGTIKAKIVATVAASTTIIITGLPQPAWLYTFFCDASLQPRQSSRQTHLKPSSTVFGHRRDAGS